MPGRWGRWGIVCIVAVSMAVALFSDSSRAQQPPSTSLDPFLCYKTRTTPKTSKFTPVLALPLVDQFEDRVFDVTQSEQLCLPTSVSTTSLLDPVTHLESYQLRAPKSVCTSEAPQHAGSACKTEEDCGGVRGETDFCEGAPKHVKQTHVRVENAPFGSLLLDTIKPDSLLVPTTKCIDDPPGSCPTPLPAPDPQIHAVDHYKCYAVKVSPKTPKFPSGFQTSLVDQFAEPALYDVVKPTRLCNPVEKNGEPIKDIDTHVMCYQVKRTAKICAPGAPLNTGGTCRRELDCGGVQRSTSFCTPQVEHTKVTSLHVSNQFGEERLDTVREEELCIPSAKFPNAPPQAVFIAMPESGLAPLKVQFNASASSDPDGVITKYTWDFGDKQKGKGVTAAHTYSKPGTYTATLTVEDEGGKTAIANRTITVTETGGPPPPFTLTATPGTAGVIQGQSASYAVTLHSTGGFAQLATLAVSGLPAGVTASSKPKQITTDQTAIVTITTPTTQPPASVPLAVSASAKVNGHDTTQAVNLTLNILPITTSFIGRTVVADTLETPLAGVTITFLGKDDNNNPTGCTGQTVADAAGNFMFTNLPPECTGGQLIRYDGTVATSPPGVYAGVDLFYDIVPNQVTVSPVLIHLPRIDDKEFVCVQQNAPQDQIFTFQTIPNMTVTVYAGTTFTPHPQYPPPAGKCPLGSFALIAIDVPVDRLPDAMPPDMNSVMPFIVAFQPPNAVASQPVAVSFPNLLNTPPGTPMQLSTLDPTKGVMVPYGTGAVSTDGTQIVPDLDPDHPGHRYGLVHFDWHGPMPGPPSDPGPCPSGSCCTLKGDPIDLSTGLTLIRETDIAINSLRGAVSIVRTYRTNSVRVGPFGLGGQHNYSYLLNTNTPWSVPVVNLIMPDGNQFPFVRQQNGTLINTTIPALRGAVLTTPVESQAILRWKDGTTFRFQPRGFDLGIAASTLESITDANGNTITLVRDPSRVVRITEVIDPVGRKLTLSYDGSNRITSITDPIGRTVQYTYSAQGTLETVTDPEGGVSRYEYDAQNRLTRVINARDVVIAQNTYDANGRVIEQQQADGGKLQFDYTLFNPLAPTSPVSRTVVTDPLGNQTTYRFDPQGFLLDVTDPFEQTRIFEREPGSNLLLSIKGQGSCDTCGNASVGDERFTYDGNGNVLSRTDALNHTTQFAYDPVFNKVTAITEPTNPPATTSFTYDSKGNLTARKDANNHTTSFAYNPFGLLTKIIDPLNKETTFAYDSFGNLTSITDPLNHVTSFRYDAISRQIETTDALGRKSGTAYDKLNRVVEQTNAKGDKTQFAYDEVGNLLAVTDARNNTTEFIYDGMNRLLTKETPLGKVDTRSYDFNGNLKTFTDRRNLTSQYAYDALDRLISETYADSSVAREYDAQSRLLRVEDSVAGDFEFTYDLVGRTKSATSPFGTVQYGYDAVGRVLSRQVGGQSAVDYDYDPVGNLTKAEMPQASVTLTYDNRDQLHVMNRSNGVSSTYEYDPVGRVLSLTHAKGATMLNSQTYEYDEIGNRTHYETNIAQSLITQPVADGNYDNDNKLLSNSNKTFTYDDNGNLTSETGPEGTTTYTWDARNRLASIAMPDGQTINFLYDFAGNLIRKSVSGTSPSSQEYVLDEITNIAYQKNSDGSQMSIVTGQSIDTHLAVVGAGGQVDFGLTDTINSTTTTTDQDGALGPLFFYEPFGQTTTNGDYPFQFTGRVPATDNLYHYRARYYAPSVGRFVSEDPIGFSGQDLNLYRYVFNRPIILVDPTGRKVNWLCVLNCFLKYGSQAVLLGVGVATCPPSPVIFFVGGASVTYAYYLGQDACSCFLNCKEPDPSVVCLNPPKPERRNPYNPLFDVHISGGTVSGLSP